MSVSLDWSLDVGKGLSPYFVGRLAVNYPDILSDVSRWITLIVCRMSHGELSWHFVGCLTVNYLDILSDVSRWIILIFCRMSHVNYLDSLSDVSRWIILTFCRMSHGELSWYFVGCLTVNYLDILSDVSRWIISIFYGMPHVELTWYFVGHVTVNILGAFWNFQISDILVEFLLRLWMLTGYTGFLHVLIHYF
jgi:hypothetical protein